jgi:hypothetical protein
MLIAAVCPVFVGIPDEPGVIRQVGMHHVAVGEPRSDTM